MRPVHTFLPLALAALLAGMAVGGGSSDTSAPTVALTDLAKKGRDLLGRELHFALQVESQPAEWNAYVTSFGLGDYRAVIAWGDEQDLWLRDAYESPAAMLFARRGTAAELALAAAPRYARFEATGTIRQMFAGRAWIEITELAPLPGRFTTGSMVHASRGMELMAAEHWVLAAQSFERALAGELSLRAQAELDLLRLDCLARSSRPIEIQVRRKRD